VEAVSGEFIGWHVPADLAGGRAFGAQVADEPLQMLRGAQDMLALMQESCQFVPVLLGHYWVLAKLALTTAATVVLMLNTRTMVHLAEIASDPSRQDFDALGGQLLHSGAGLLLLVAVTLLAVYKPRGLTPYGWNKQQKSSERAPA
jgi:hypothetical protein